MTRSRQTADWGSRAGLAKIIPSSVAVGSGTGSADSTGKVTFSGCSSVSLNEVFSSTYTNYRIVFDNLQSATSNQGLSLRVRANTTDLTSGVYEFQTAGASGTTATASRSSSTEGAMQVAEVGSTKRSSAILEIFNPQVATETVIYSMYSYYATSVGIINRTTAGYVNNTSQYNGFTIFVGTSISGNLTVYGYN